VLVDTPLAWDALARRALVSGGAAADGRAAGAAKPCRTTVTWLATLRDGTHLVHCQAHTGRRHQIRCHLAALGLPVANDLAYGGTHSAPQPRAPLPPPFADDGNRALRAALGPDAACFRAWCHKCAWTDEQLRRERPPLPAAPAAAEIWLRSWRYVLPVLGIDVTSPLPPWAVDSTNASR
jgi:hypothetical protein